MLPAPRDRHHFPLTSAVAPSSLLAGSAAVHQCHDTEASAHPTRAMHSNLCPFAAFLCRIKSSVIPAAAQAAGMTPKSAPISKTSMEAARPAHRGRVMKTARSFELQSRRFFSISPQGPPADDANGRLLSRLPQGVVLQNAGDQVPVHRGVGRAQHLALQVVDVHNGGAAAHALLDVGSHLVGILRPQHNIGVVGGQRVWGGAVNGLGRGSRQSCKTSLFCQSAFPPPSRPPQRECARCRIRAAPFP